jgi:hypothetical protein
MSAARKLLGELRPTSSAHTRSWWEGVADDQEVIFVHAARKYVHLIVAQTRCTPPKNVSQFAARGAAATSILIVVSAPMEFGPYSGRWTKPYLRGHRR